MVQQLKNNKADKQLTLNDLAKISYASSLNLFHTNSMFSPWPFGIFYSLDLYYVKRLSSNNYQQQQIWATTESGNSPNTMFKGCTNPTTKTRNEIEAIYSDLVCNKDGDERLALLCRYRRMNFEKSKIGLFLIEPNTAAKYNRSEFLIYWLVITPKPGLFPIKK